LWNALFSIFFISLLLSFNVWREFKLLKVKLEIFSILFLLMLIMYNALKIGLLKNRFVITSIPFLEQLNSPW
jgi:hypothetical protein